MDLLKITEEIKDIFKGSELCRMQAAQVEGLSKKLTEDDVIIAVIGQFKRGKTTLVNSIIGKKLLPVGIVPITAAVTRIEYGEGGDDKGEVFFANGLSSTVDVEDLSSYISEQENKNNQRGVTEVLLKTDSQFLKRGIVLVDTPGVGSIHENNSKSAYDFVKESDGVIFMLSVDSPINQIEVDFLKSVRKYAGKFYFTVNKVDTVDGEDLEEYLQYCQMLLGNIMGEDRDEKPEIRLLPISGKKNIGIHELTETISHDLAENKKRIVENSVRRKLLDVLSNTVAQVRSYRNVLKMAPNVFNRRFDEINRFLEDRRAGLEELNKAGGQDREMKLLRAQVNDEKTYLAAKVKELFDIEYYYYIDRSDAADMLSVDEYIEEMEETYQQLAQTLNAIFMYKEENAYTVARRIEDLNILLRKTDRFRKEIEAGIENE